MTDRPIIFSAPMVRALLEGRKTQTRRVLKLPKKTFSGGPIYERPDMGGWEATTSGGPGVFFSDGSPAPERIAIWHRTTGVCMETPHQPGDRLWVREALRRNWMVSIPTGVRPTTIAVAFYSADGRECLSADGFLIHWTRRNDTLPAMLMGRSFSRLTLIVESVKVQRLQDISEQDALAEGIDHYPRSAFNLRVGWYSPGFTYENGEFSNLPGAYMRKWQETWTSIHGPGAWDANPWVAALTFRVVKANIDRLPEGA